MWATFRGKRYRVYERRMPDAWGKCWPDAQEIAIDPRANGQKLLMTLLDEGITACFPDLDNAEVDRASTDMARWLWRYGFRAVDRSIARK
jgi:hypothetical protein